MDCDITESFACLFICIKLSCFLRSTTISMYLFETINVWFPFESTDKSSKNVTPSFQPTPPPPQPPSEKNQFILQSNKTN